MQIDKHIDRHADNVRCQPAADTDLVRIRTVTVQVEQHVHREAQRHAKQDCPQGEHLLHNYHSVTCLSVLLSVYPPMCLSIYQPAQR